MKLSRMCQETNARDFLALSDPAVEPGEIIDRVQLAERMANTIADAEDVENIAQMIEQHFNN